MSGVRSQTHDFQKLSTREKQENCKGATPDACSSLEAWNDSCLKIHS